MEQSNRESFLKAKKFLSQFKNIEFYDSEIYLLLIKANSYTNFTELIKNFDENLANPDYFFRNIQRIKDGEPIQYVVGEAPFFDLDINVNRNVLIPRPETEGLVKLLIDETNKNKYNHKIIADVCTGTGCIALYLKKKFPNSEVYASDKYKDVLDVAISNFDKYHMNIITLEGSRLEPFISRSIKLDILVSNPPYVDKMEDIEENVKKFEPLNAIYLENGTRFYESYFKHYKEVMNKKFVMAFEINYDQEEKLTFLIKNYFNTNEITYKFYKDVFDRTRYLIITGGYNESSR